MRTSRFGFAGAALALLLLGCGRDLHVWVVSEYGETPVAGARVQVDDRPWEIADDFGWVTFKGVGPSFVLRVHQITSGNDFRFDDVWVLQSPEGSPVKILADGSGVDEQHTANIFGPVSGGSGGPIRVYAAIHTRGPMTWTQAAGDGTFSLDASWEGIGQRSATIHALELDGAQPGHYRAYGKSEINVSDPAGTGGSTSTSVSLRPVNEVTVPATVAVPPELAGVPVQASTSLQLTAGTMWLESAGVTGPSLAAVFPQVPGMPGWLDLRAFEPQDPLSAWSLHSQRFSLPASGVSFDLPVPVTLLEPAEGAVIDASTVFRWTGGPPGGRNALLLACEWTDTTGAARHFNFRNVEVTGAEASLPALTDLPIEAGASCSWSVAWYPADSHLGATGAEEDASERRYSTSRTRTATFR